MDIVPPFTGAIADRFCVFACDSNTEFFRSYLELLSLILLRAKQLEHAEKDFQVLSRTISDLKKSAYALFSQY